MATNTCYNRRIVGHVIFYAVSGGSPYHFYAYSQETRVEAGSSTSIVAPRAVGVHEKGDPVPGVITGSPCPWGLKIPRPGLRGWVSLESETLKYGHESRGTRT
jgi:hypothetical protein